MIDPARQSLSGLRLWLAAEPDRARRTEIRILMARTMRHRGMFKAARGVLREAMKETPSDPTLRRSMGLELFRGGQIREGIELYDSGRWKLESFRKYHRAYPFPTWGGEPLQGRRILLWAEQGIGDQIMQLRVIPQLVAAGAEVTLEADPRLKALLGPIARQVNFVPQMVELDRSLARARFDFQSSLLSAWVYMPDPLECGDCLFPDPKLIENYQAAWQKLGRGIDVGLSWRSSAKVNGAERSIPLEELRPLTHGKTARFHNLQYGELDVTAASRAFGAPLLTDPDSDPLTDLTRQAAQIAALDLVITIDNATAHLAGALGKPVWILLPKGSDFRWGTMVRPNELYPHQRLFRSGNAGDWSSALWSLFEAFQRFQPGTTTP
ncbi:glycosyltransferase family protein [Pseudooceanicola nitratireducens]|uniref:hypothetical protein n=1 Tax=Pseudooceanicola nitratireducens TaxID=517719 RepID=UPI001C96D786|nr:hypothetical protein [Pseudooceanicola nitratireducens]MBY6156651.1 hypothetical protein [Pseudooceanicola nitratireducens]